MGTCSVAGVVLVSLLTLLTELSLNFLAAYYLYTRNQIVCFSVLVCILLLVSVVIQFISWRMHSIRKSQKKSPLRNAGVVILHIFQAGIFWRYMRILASQKFSVTRKELWETFLLRTVHCLCSSVPVLLMMTYLLITTTEWKNVVAEWPILSSLAATLLSGSWGLAGFRKHSDYCCIIGAVFPGIAIFFKFGWRLGEVISRVLTIVMFAQVQSYWVFLVVGGHWITMLVLVTAEAVLQDPSKANRKESFSCKRIIGLLLKSYVYIFCYLNPSGGKSKFGTAVYYIITCMENIALLALWIVYDKRPEIHLPLALVATISCAVGLAFGALYYSCFHRTGTSHNQDNTEIACLYECLDCSKKTCNDNSPKRVQSNSRPKPWETSKDSVSPILQANSLLPPEYDLTRSRGFHNETGHTVPTVANVRALDGGYHNALMNKQQGQRSQTPLVLMESEQQARIHTDNHSKRHGSHSRAASLDFLWDNYDLQIRDHLEYRDSDIEGMQVPKKLRIHNFHHAQDPGIGTPTQDQGYYSAMSSSSKENSQRRKAAMAAIMERDPIHNLRSLHSHSISPVRGRRHEHSLSGGAVSDGNTSSYSTTSSKRAIVNCGKCGNSLSIDSTSMAPSMFSLASSTSFASSAPSSYYPRRRASIHVMDRNFYRRRQRKRLMQQARFGGEEPETLEQAMARIYGAGLPVRQSMRSDITSSAWEYTDSEI